MESSVADSPAERALETRAGERARAKLMKFSDAMSRDLLPETGPARRAGGRPGRWQYRFNSRPSTALHAFSRGRSGRRAGGGESWRQRSAVAVDNAASAAAAAAAAAANTRWNANLLAIATATARPTRGIRRQTTSE